MLPAVLCISKHRWRLEQRCSTVCPQWGASLLPTKPKPGLVETFTYPLRLCFSLGHLCTKLGFREITDFNRKQYLWQHSFHSQEGDRSDANGRSPLKVHMGGACQVSSARTRAQSWVPGLHCLMLLGSFLSPSWVCLTDLRSGALLGAKLNSIQHWEGAVRVEEGAPMPS